MECNAKINILHKVNSYDENTFIQGKKFGSLPVTHILYLWF